MVKYFRISPNTEKTDCQSVFSVFPYRPYKLCVTDVMNHGELEKLVLQHIWDIGEVDAKQVFAHFEKARGGTLNTIQSTLDPLFEKGLLSREK